MVEDQVADEHADGVTVRCALDELRGAYQTGTAGNVGDDDVLGEHVIGNSIDGAAHAGIRGAAGRPVDQSGDVLFRIGALGGGGVAALRTLSLGGDLAAAAGQAAADHQCCQQQSGQFSFHVDFPFSPSFKFYNLPKGGMRLGKVSAG